MEGKDWMDRQGFGLIQLLFAVSIIGILFGIAYPYTTLMRRKANLTAGLRYAQDVATSLEALRHPLTGLISGPSDCSEGFGNTPAAVEACTVNYPDPMNFVIQIELRGATHSQVIYDGRTGELASLP